ncbi:hypothetical protein CVT26_015584 [Gymnopilus dilepis]|uniref:CHAT domain-containing protein n=1 Tax=Gymnopilus dilepis TaxID=231916 RepID=A0A409XYP6_9AGAR|nr:hypothetical protein CVT26_015584 [Gymnopilus dilepis]
MPPDISADTDTPISPDLLPGSNLPETGQIPQDDATKGWSLHWLAWELLKAFKQTQDGSLVDASIQVYHKAIPYLSNPNSNPTHSAKAHRDLGNAYYERYKRFGRPGDIDAAIQHHQQGVTTDPSSSSSDEKFPALLNQQAMLHVCRFDCTGELLDLSEAIQLCQRAAELTPDGDADKPAWLANLASAFFSRFQRTVDVGDISQAVQLQARAIELLPEGHADMPFMLANLGNLYHSQAAITDDVADMLMGVQCHQEAVELIPDDHPDYASKLSHCGIALCSLFERTQDLEDISQAITLQKKAVDLTPQGHVDLPTWIINLANSFSSRYRRTDDLSDLSQAIQLYERAIAATPDAHGDLPQWMNNLGSAFAARFRRTQDPADIHRSIQQRQNAVELTPEGHAHLSDRLKDLGTSFVYRFRHTQDHEALVSAAYNYRLSATCATGHPLVRLTSAMHWARLSPQISPEEVLDAHEQITRLLSLVSGLENTLEHRRWLLLGTSRLSTTAAAAALSVNRPSKALEWLEEGRCIIWGQLNQLRTPLDDLRTCDPVLASRLEVLSKQLDNAPGLRKDSYSLDSATDSPQINTHDVSPIPGHIRLRLVKERDELLSTIRKIPRFENFLQPRKCTDLMKSIPDEGIVVVINADETRCDALILIPGRSEPIHVPLGRLSYEEAVRLTKALRRNLKSRRVRGEFVEVEEAGPQFRAARYPFTSFQDSLRDILRVLWCDLVGPILDVVPLEVRQHRIAHPTYKQRRVQKRRPSDTMETQGIINAYLFPDQ